MKIKYCEGMWVYYKGSPLGFRKLGWYKLRKDGSFYSSYIIILGTKVVNAIDPQGYKLPWILLPNEWGCPEPTEEVIMWWKDFNKKKEPIDQKTLAVYNSDGRRNCYNCNEPLSKIPGITTVLSICKFCEK